MIPHGVDLAAVRIADADGNLVDYVALVQSLPIALTRRFSDQPRVADDWMRRLPGRRDAGSQTIPLAYDDAEASAAGFRSIAASQIEQTPNTTRAVQIDLGGRRLAFNAIIVGNFVGIPEDDYLTNPVTLDVDGPLGPWVDI